MKRILFLVCLLGQAWALPPATWVISVGNNRGDANEVALRYAERDAAEFVEVLTRLGGVQPARVVLLKGQDAGALTASIRDVAARVKAHGDPDSAIVLFYSGHADATALHLGGTHLPLAELEDALRGSPASLRLLFIDACRSGTVSRVKGMRAAKPFDFDVDDRMRVDGVAIITSSTAGENSQESDELRGSFFSHHLINGLRGAADRNGDTRVTLGEAYAYTYAQTLRSSGRTMQLQHPTYAFDFKGQGEVVLAQVDRDGRRSGRLQLGDPAVYVVVEGGGTLTAEVSPAHADAQLTLPPRGYLVQERLPREYREYTVAVRAGQTTRLSDHDYRSLTYDQLVRVRGAPNDWSQGLMLLGGGRGEVLDGEGASGQLVLGWGADLPWFSPGLRLRLSSVDANGVDGASPRRHDEVGLGVTLQRFVDFNAFSIAFGVLIEGSLHRQVYTGSRPIPDRQTIAAAFGGLFTVERHLFNGLALHVEGGPLSLIHERQLVVDDVPAGSEIATPLTWWAALGVVWRL